MDGFRSGDLLGRWPALLAAFGAHVTPIGRSDTFVPIDTKAHRPEDLAFIRHATAGDSFDALVTTDGDADRPLVADDAGRVVRGDVLGLIISRHLDVDALAVPVTAGSAIKHIGGFRRVVRTKVGWPLVIAGMNMAKRDGAETVAVFEANGGFLLGFVATVPGGRLLAALPTRDALLPILATLAAARSAGGKLADLVASLGVGETASDRLPDTSAERSRAFMARLGDEGYLRNFFAPVGAPLSVDGQDEVRIELDGGRSVHFRPLGNAPELRCYAQAGAPRPLGASRRPGQGSVEAYMMRCRRISAGGITREPSAEDRIIFDAWRVQPEIKPAPTLMK